MFASLSSRVATTVAQFASGACRAAHVVAFRDVRNDRRRCGDLRHAAATPGPGATIRTRRRPSAPAPPALPDRPARTARAQAEFEQMRGEYRARFGAAIPD